MFYFILFVGFIDVLLPCTQLSFEPLISVIMISPRKRTLPIHEIWATVTAKINKTLVPGRCMTMSMRASLKKRLTWTSFWCHQAWCRRAPKWIGANLYKKQDIGSRQLSWFGGISGKQAVLKIKSKLFRTDRQHLLNPNMVLLWRVLKATPTTRSMWKSCVKCENSRGAGEHATQEIPEVETKCPVCG